MVRIAHLPYFGRTIALPYECEGLFLRDMVTTLKMSLDMFRRNPQLSCVTRSGNNRGLGNYKLTVWRPNEFNTFVVTVPPEIIKKIYGYHS